MITFFCPGCETSLQVADQFAGHQAKCPACGRAATVPSESVAATRIRAHQARRPSGAHIVFAVGGGVLGLVVSYFVSPSLFGFRRGFGEWLTDVGNWPTVTAFAGIGAILGFALGMILARIETR